MTDAEAAARGVRAKAAWDEFVAPPIEVSRKAYQDRILEVATTELDPRKRTEKITALSFALKMLNNIEAGLLAAIEDGKQAEKTLLRRDDVERMTPEKRRLLEMAPFR